MCLKLEHVSFSVFNTNTHTVEKNWRTFIKIELYKSAIFRLSDIFSDQILYFLVVVLAIYQQTYNILNTYKTRKKFFHALQNNEFDSVSILWPTMDSICLVMLCCYFWPLNAVYILSILSLHVHWLLRSLHAIDTSRHEQQIPNISVMWHHICQQRELQSISVVLG